MSKVNTFCIAVLYGLIIIFAFAFAPTGNVVAEVNTGVFAISLGCIAITGATFYFIYSVLGNQALISSPVALVALSYLFHFPYLMLNSVDMADFSSVVIWSWNSYYSSAFIALLLHTSMCVGIVFSLTPKYRCFFSRSAHPGNAQLNVMMKYAKVVYVAGLGLAAAFIISKGKQLFSGGYGDLGAVYTQNSASAGLYLIAEILIRSGLIVISTVSATLYGRLFPSRLFLVLTVTFMAFLILQGDRGGVFFLLIILGSIYSLKIKRIRLLSLCVAVLVSLLAISAVRYGRYSQERSFSSMAQTISQSEKIGVLDALENTGGSFTVLNRTVATFDAGEEIWLGKSYLYGLIRLIPLSNPETILGSNANPDTWVTYTTDINRYNAGGGLGFSALTEAYLNFGVYGGCICLFLFGLAVGNSTLSYFRFPSYTALVAQIWLIHFISLTSRGSLSVASRYLFYGILINLALFSVANRRRSLA